MSVPKSPKVFDPSKFGPPKKGGPLKPPKLPGEDSPLQRPAVLGGFITLGIFLIVCLATVLAFGPERICGSVLLLFGSLLFAVNWIQQWLPEGCVPGCVRGVLLLALLAGLALVVGGDRAVDLFTDLTNSIR